MAWQGRARHGLAWQGKARQGMAWAGSARQGEVMDNQEGAHEERSGGSEIPKEVRDYLDAIACCLHDLTDGDTLPKAWVDYLMERIGHGEQGVAGLGEARSGWAGRG